MVSDRHKKCFRRFREDTRSRVPDFFKRSAGETRAAESTSRSASPESVASTSSLSSSSASTGLSSIIIANDRLLEVVWALKMVASHYSCKSSEHVADVFRLMFPDSQIDLQFKCSETKSRYLITFGLAPYFSELTLQKLKSSEDYVLLFDESLNHKNQTKQLDFHVRCWNENVVETRFSTSEFLDHATAVDLEEKFNKVILDFHLKPSSLVQISMDGLAVNLKLLEHIDSDLMENYNVGLLHVGSDGLHVVHNAFTRGCEAMQWDIESFLSAAYTLFKDSPARREDFFSLTGYSTLPPKFCCHRWLESISVALKAIDMLPYLEQYMKAALEKKITLPKNKSFETVKAGVMSTPLLARRLVFFCSVASVLEPFLTKYQADQPLLPFMSTDLQDILNNLMRRFVKGDVLLNCTAQKLVQVDVGKSSNLIHLSKVELGFQAERLLAEVRKRSTMMEGSAVAFRGECRDFLKAVVEKLQEKPPLKYTLARNLSCLNPIMMSDKETSINRMKRVPQCLQAAKRLDDEACDMACQEYTKFLDVAVAKLNADQFDTCLERLDVWLHYTMAGKPEFCDQETSAAITWTGSSRKRVLHQ